MSIKSLTISRLTLASITVSSLGSPFLTGTSLTSLSLDELMRMEVTTPGKIPEAIRDTPASVYLVSREEIETFGYATLTEVFENVPGFYNIDNYTGISGNFGIRGFWNGRSQNSSVAILINGVPQTRVDTWSHPMDMLNVPVEAIDRIEISRGPNSVIYGNGAAFGAINIITDESFKDDVVTVSYGNLDTTKTALRWSEFGEDFHVIVNAGHSVSQGFDHDLYQLVGPENQQLLPAFGVTDANSSLDGKLEQHQDFLQVAGAWRDFYFDYTHNKANVEPFSGFPSVEGGNQRDVESSRYSIGLDSALGDRVNWDTRLTYGTYRLGQLFDALYPGFEGRNSLEYNNWDFESLLAYTPSENFHLVAGVNWQRMQDFYEYTHVPALGLRHEVVAIERRDTRAIFSQFSYDLSKVLRLVAGYRLEELRPFERRGYTNVEIDEEPTFGGTQGGFENGTPRVSLIYQPDESQVLKLMVGDAIKVPSYPDRALDTERVRTTEVNYSWTNHDTLISASVFVNALSNLYIEELKVLPGGLVDFDLRAGGEVDTRGLELLVRRDLGDHVRTELGATWQDSDYAVHPEELLSYSPELVAHGKISYESGDFTASVLSRYVDSMHSFYTSSPGGGGLGADGFFGDPVESRFVVDLNARWNDVWEKVYISVHLTNAFDTEIWYPNNPINGLLLDRGHLGHGRRLRVEAGLKF